MPHEEESQLRYAGVPKVMVRFVPPLRACRRRERRVGTGAAERLSRRGARGHGQWLQHGWPTAHGAVVAGRLLIWGTEAHCARSAARCTLAQCRPANTHNVVKYAVCPSG